jgi:hypothetical protein
MVERDRIDQQHIDRSDPTNANNEGKLKKKNDSKITEPCQYFMNKPITGMRLLPVEVQQSIPVGL